MVSEQRESCWYISKPIARIIPDANAERKEWETNVHEGASSSNDDECDGDGNGNIVDDNDDDGNNTASEELVGLMSDDKKKRLRYKLKTR